MARPSGGRAGHAGVRAGSAAERVAGVPPRRGSAARGTPRGARQQPQGAAGVAGHEVRDTVAVDVTGPDDPVVAGQVPAPDGAAVGHEGPVRAQERGAGQPGRRPGAATDLVEACAASRRRIGDRKPVFPLPGKTVIAPAAVLADRSGNAVAGDVTDRGRGGDRAPPPAHQDWPAELAVAEPRTQHQQVVAGASRVTRSPLPSRFQSPTLSSWRAVGDREPAHDQGRRWSAVARGPRPAGCRRRWCRPRRACAAGHLAGGEPADREATANQPRVGPKRAVAFPVRILSRPVRFERTTTSPMPSPVRSAAPPATELVPLATDRDAQHGAPSPPVAVPGTTYRQPPAFIATTSGGRHR